MSQHDHTQDTPSGVSVGSSLAAPLSRQLYQMIVRQLHFDGYVAAASTVSDAAGLIVPSIEEDGNRLLRLVARGLACEAVDARDRRSAASLRVVERYLNASKLYMPLAFASDAFVGQAAHAVHERFCSAALGGALRNVAFSPDGNLIACAGANGLASILSWQTMNDLVVQEDVQLRRCTNAADTTTHGRNITDGGVGGSGSARRRQDCRRMRSANEITELATARRLRGHHRSVEFVQFHPTQSILASGGHDKCMHMHNYAQPASPTVLSMRDDYVLRAAAFHPSGEYVLYATDHPVVRLASMQTGAVLTPTTSTVPLCHTAGNEKSGERGTGHTAGLTSVSYTHDARTFATSSLDGAWTLYDGASGKPTHRTADAHSAVAVTSVMFSASGNYLLTCGMDSVARLWDVRQLSDAARAMSMSYADNFAQHTRATHSVGEVMSFGTPAKCEHRSIRASFGHHEGQVVMQDATLTSIQFYDMVTGDMVCKTSVQPAVVNRTFAVSSRLPLYATGGDDNRLRLWAPTWSP